jgi:hypothetical protein
MLLYSEKCIAPKPKPDPPYNEHGTQAGHKSLASFPSKEAYAKYLKSILQVGMKVVAVSGDRKGDRGKYLGTNDGRPPCHVEWEDFGQGWWVEWHDVEIAEGALGRHEMKKVSGSVKCLGCGMFGPSSQTGANFCDRCHICETCCKAGPQCAVAQRQGSVDGRSVGKVSSNSSIVFLSWN